MLEAVLKGLETADELETLRRIYHYRRQRQTAHQQRRGQQDAASHFAIVLPHQIAPRVRMLRRFMGKPLPLVQFVRYSPVFIGRHGDEDYASTPNI